LRTSEGKLKSKRFIKLKKSSIGKSPNESKDSGNYENQGNDISLSGAETEDNNVIEDGEEELSPNDEVHQESENEDLDESTIREDPQPSNNVTPQVFALYNFLGFP
jgi:hypothetical protein